MNEPNWALAGHEALHTKLLTLGFNETTFVNCGISMFYTNILVIRHPLSLQPTNDWSTKLLKGKLKLP